MAFLLYLAHAIITDEPRWYPSEQMVTPLQYVCAGNGSRSHCSFAYPEAKLKVKLGLFVFYSMSKAPTMRNQRLADSKPSSLKTKAEFPTGTSYKTGGILSSSCLLPHPPSFSNC